MTEYRLGAFNGNQETGLSLMVNSGTTLEAYEQACVLGGIKHKTEFYDKLCVANDTLTTVPNEYIYLLPEENVKRFKDSMRVEVIPGVDYSYLKHLPVSVSIKLFLSNEKVTAHITPEDVDDSTKIVYAVESTHHTYDFLVRNHNPAIFVKTALITTTKGSDLHLWCTLNGLQPETTHLVTSRRAVEEKFQWVIDQFGEIDWLVLKRKTQHDKFITLG